MLRIIICLCLLLLLTCCSHQEKGPDPQPTKGLCRDFVQDFYDWYLADAKSEPSDNPNKQDNVHGVDRVLRDKRNALSPELYLALKEDSDAQAESPDAIVGFDADPFFNGQDYQDKYAATNVTVKDNHYFVEVHEAPDPEGRNPAVVAELIFKDGSWVFVNLHYGPEDTGGLLETLKDLKEERENPSNAWCTRLEPKGANASPTESCRIFVKEFYDWYNGLDPQHSELPINTLLREKQSALSPEIYRGLKKLSEDDAKSRDGSSRLPFEPIRGIEDPVTCFVVGGVTVKENHYWVNVFDFNGSRKDPNRRVIPELIHQDGQWVFVNFHYIAPDGGDSDLLSLLKDLENEK